MSATTGRAPVPVVAAPAIPLRACRFLVPGDWHVATGGYVYDRRIAEGLRPHGWAAAPLTLDASFPQPTHEALAQAEAAVAALADGTVVVADGLAFGALPDIAERHARRLRWVALVHHPLASETGLGAVRAAELFANERRALAAARAVVVTSAATARALADYGVPASKRHVVEPGTDPAPLAPGSGGPGLSLLCVATLTPRKGHAVLVEALAGLRDRAWTLRCVGSTDRDTATAVALRQALTAAGLADRVSLLGEVGAEQLDALYAAADLFVLPSFHEGYGMALAEALARGLPIVSTAAGAIPDTVPADAGVLLPPGDAAAWRAALAELMDEPGRRLALARGARAARGRLPGWPAACARFAAVLDAVAAAEGGP